MHNAHVAVRNHTQQKHINRRAHRAVVDRNGKATIVISKKKPDNLVPDDCTTMLVVLLRPLAAKSF